MCCWMPSWPRGWPTLARPGCRPSKARRWGHSFTWPPSRPTCRPPPIPAGTSTPWARCCIICWSGSLPTALPRTRSACVRRPRWRRDWPSTARSSRSNRPPRAISNVPASIPGWPPLWTAAWPSIPPNGFPPPAPCRRLSRPGPTTSRCVRRSGWGCCCRWCCWRDSFPSPSRRSAAVPVRTSRLWPSGRSKAIWSPPGCWRTPSKTNCCRGGGFSKSGGPLPNCRRCLGGSTGQPPPRPGPHSTSNSIPFAPRLTGFAPRRGFPSTRAGSSPMPPGYSNGAVPPVPCRGDGRMPGATTSMPRGPIIPSGATGPAFPPSPGPISRSRSRARSASAC